MSHLIESMAFVGATPWHGLGNPLSPQQPLEVWLTEAGMDWRIEQSDVLFNVADDGMHIRPFADSKVLYRSDSLAPLSVVSPRYKVVQPSEVLEFYRDLVSAGGFELETAGVLKGGRKLWALAKTGQEALLKGGDRVKAYLLLATSCDGTLCTTAQFTSVGGVQQHPADGREGQNRCGEGAPLHRVRSAAGEGSTGLGLSAGTVSSATSSSCRSGRSHRKKPASSSVKYWTNRWWKAVRMPSPRRRCSRYRRCIAVVAWVRCWLVPRERPGAW
jgi:hypothetical protein